MFKKILFLFSFFVLILAPSALADPGKAVKLEKITYVRYKTGAARVSLAKPTLPQNSCYSYLANGAKWLITPVNYTVNSNGSGLSDTQVIAAIASSTAEWDRYTSRKLFGASTIDYTANWDNVAPDGRNEFSFGNYSDPNVIAITNVWGYFSGVNKRIIEFDVMFDTDFTWGDAATNPSVMDLQNIATHEIGHGLGLGDIYSSSCNLQTMYGYSSNGDISKRDLYIGDITGLRKLYGY